MPLQGADSLQYLKDIRKDIVMKMDFASEIRFSGEATVFPCKHISQAGTELCCTSTVYVKVGVRVDAACGKFSRRVFLPDSERAAAYVQ